MNEHSIDSTESRAAWASRATLRWLQDRRAGALRWLLAALSMGCLAGPVQANCGAEGQRACKVFERIPSCDVNLSEHAATNQCVRPACGREGERVCAPHERVLWDFLLARPVPQPCDANLKLDLGRGVCVHPACGREGQPACTLLVRVPSCDLNLTERDGHCVRPACGRIGERACNVPTERMVIAASAGLCDANLVLGLKDKRCQRPGLATPDSGQTHAAAPAAPAAPPPPAVAPPPPAGGGTPNTGAPPAPPGGFMLPAPGKTVAPLPPPPMAAMSPNDLSASWRINGNGHAGDLVIRQAADGTLAGTLYGEPMSGYFAAGERTAVMLRGPAGQPIQAYVAQVSPDGTSLSGRFYALNSHSAGGATSRNVFAFAAQRGANAPASPGTLPAGNAGPASAGGAFDFDGNGHRGLLQLKQAADGGLTGTAYQNDRVDGHYAAGTSTLAFLRSSGGQVIQLFTGVMAGGSLRGEFYALTPPAGATAQRMRYAWNAAPQGPAAAAATPAPAVIPPAANAAGMELDADRPGADLLGFELARPEPAQCQTACALAGRCQAWTFVKAGVRGPAAQCLLKSAAPEPRPDSCCVSGRNAATNMATRNLR